MTKKKMIFDPVSPSFKYAKNNLELRKVYKNICVNGRHSLQYDEAIAMSRTSDNFFNLRRASKGSAGNKFRATNSRIFSNNQSKDMLSQMMFKQPSVYRGVSPNYGESIDFIDGKMNDSLMSFGF